jgi:ankyrin repeat protein
MVAALAGNADIVRMLVAAGADVNAQDKSKGGLTALMVAALAGNADIAKMLIAAGADVNAKRTNGVTVLMAAALAENEHEMGVRVVADGIMKEIDYTPQNAKAAVAKLLIEAKADVNAKTSENQTALMAAAEVGNADIIKMLVAAGADVNVKAEQGYTALAIAKENGPTEIVRLLEAAGAR